jgi:acyl carrier protein
VRGFRIELGEIEAALAAQPTVRQAVVTVQPDHSGERRLVAYIVARDGAATASELRTALKRSLPDYMLPSVFINLESLPLTANLKVDRQALPTVFSSTTQDRYVEPRTSAERALAEIWQTVLGIERVSADANFFDVGGHSLLAMRVLARIEERFGVRVGPRALMLDTLSQLAAHCERQFEAATGEGSELRQGVAGAHTAA